MSFFGMFGERTEWITLGNFVSFINPVNEFDSGTTKFGK